MSEPYYRAFRRSGYKSTDYSMSGTRKVTTETRYPGSDEVFRGTQELPEYEIAGFKKGERPEGWTWGSPKRSNQMILWQRQPDSTIIALADEYFRLQGAKTSGISVHTEGPFFDTLFFTDRPWWMLKLVERRRGSLPLRMLFDWWLGTKANLPPIEPFVGPEPKPGLQEWIRNERRRMDEAHEARHKAITEKIFEP